jgi:phenolic acid decarboxylase
VKLGINNADTIFAFNKFIFTHYVVEAFEAILAAKQISSDQAVLVHRVVTEYLSDELFSALNDYDQEVIQNLLVPFLEKDEAPREEIKEAINLVNPIEWMHEAIETLNSVQRGIKDPLKAAKLKHITFSSYVAEAFLAIVYRNAIFESEVVLVNEIMSKYFDQNVYDLMSDQEKQILEHLMMPFAVDDGVDDTFFKMVA